MSSEFICQDPEMKKAGLCPACASLGIDEYDRPPAEGQGSTPSHFFDAAGTLIRLTSPVGTTYAEIAQDYGAKADPAKMDAAFRLAWKEQPPRATIAGPRAEDDRPWWRALALGTLHRGCDSLPPPLTKKDGSTLSITVTPNPPVGNFSPRSTAAWRPSRPRFPWA